MEKIWNQVIVLLVVILIGGNVTCIDMIVDGYTEIEAIEGRETFLPCMTTSLTDVSPVSGMVSSSKSVISNSVNAVRMTESTHSSSSLSMTTVTGGTIRTSKNSNKIFSTREEPALIIWYRGNSGIPIFTVDARNATSLQDSTQISSTEYEGRVEFDSRLIPPALRIKSIYVEDEGEYRCRCDFRKSRSQNFLLNLTVIVPPEKIKIMNGNTLDTVQGVIGPFDEGSSLHLICESIGGKPLPSVLWFKDGREMVDSEYSIIDTLVVRNEFKLKKLSRKDLMSKYSCRSTNSLLLNPPLEDSISIDLNLKPLEVTIISPKRILSSGVRTELSCRSSGSRPPAQITWWMGSYQIKAADVRQTLSSDGNISHSSFSFIPTPNDNQMIISCRAQNVILRNVPLEEKMLLEVHYVPQVKIVLGAKIDEENIREGMDVYFECIVNAHPSITEVTWMFEGTILFSDPSSGIIISNQSLVLQRVKRQSRGRYWCAAINSEGRGESNEFYLKVLFAPVCRPHQKTTYGVARNELVQVVCDVDSDPTNITFKWLFNDSHDSTSIRTFSSNGTRSVASYFPTSSSRNYGKMICLAENSIGRQKDPCIFNIIPANQPEAVSNCSVKNQSLTSLLVTCNPGDSGGLRQTFFLEVLDSLDHSLHSNMTAQESPIFLVMDLKANSKYTLLVYATNLKGRSSPVVLKPPLSTKYEKQTHQESSTDEEEDEVSIIFNPLITIVISSGIVLSLSFVSILICMIQRNKSRNSDDSGSSEGRKSNYKSSPSLSQSYGSNGRTVGNGGGYVTTEEGLLLKTLNEGMRDRNGDSHHHHHHTPFAAYSIVGCKSPTLGSSCVDTLKVITDSELDHELMVGGKEPGGGYHTTTSRVYCEEGNGTGTTRYTSVGPVIDYRPHYEYSTLGGTRTGSDLDSCQSIQFHLHPQNMTPPVSSCSESAFADSPSNPYFGQVSYENYSSPRLVIQTSGLSGGEDGRGNDPLSSCSVVNSSVHVTPDIITLGQQQNHHQQQEQNHRQQQVLLTSGHHHPNATPGVQQYQQQHPHPLHPQSAHLVNSSGHVTTVPGQQTNQQQSQQHFRFQTSSCGADPYSASPV